jgi:TolB-like protein
MSGRAVVLGVLILAVILAAIAYVGHPRISLRVQAPEKKPVLAVLPFRNLSGEPELEVVSSEIAAAVTEAAAETGKASVVPREATVGFALDRKGIEEAARSFGADYVIAGSLDEKEGHIEVDAYLFRAGPAPALWVDRLKWKPSERAAIASELAARIREVILSAPRPAERGTLLLMPESGERVHAARP